MQESLNSSTDKFGAHGISPYICIILCMYVCSTVNVCEEGSSQHKVKLIKVSKDVSSI